MSAALTEQPEMFEAESDEAMFADGPTLRKRYTASQVPAIEAKRELILLAFAAGVPVSKIAEAAHVNTRTIEALAANEAERVAENAKDFAQFCHRSGARWLGLARAKEGTAKFSELVVGAGIAIQRGNEINLLGGGVEEKALQLESAESDVRERVLRMLKQPADNGSDAKNGNNGKKENIEQPTSNAELPSDGGHRPPLQKGEPCP